MFSGRQHKQQSINDTYTTLVLEEAEKLYNKLMTELTNTVMVATATIRESLLSLPSSNNNKT